MVQLQTGEKGATQTLDLMRGLARQGSGDIRVRQLSSRLCRMLPQKDFRSEAAVCLAFVRDRIRYLKDIDGIETLHTCDTILREGQGDCDDKSILLAAMLLSIGHKPRFIAVSFSPNRYAHVWVQDYIYGRWVDLEPTEPLRYGGRIPERGVSGYLTREV